MCECEVYSVHIYLIIRIVILRVGRKIPLETKT